MFSLSLLKIPLIAEVWRLHLRLVSEGLIRCNHLLLTLKLVIIQGHLRIEVGRNQLPSAHVLENWIIHLVWPAIELICRFKLTDKFVVVTYIRTKDSAGRGDLVLKLIQTH